MLGTCCVSLTLVPGNVRFPKPGADVELEPLLLLSPLLFRGLRLSFTTIVRDSHPDLAESSNQFWRSDELREWIGLRLPSHHPLSM